MSILQRTLPDRCPRFHIGEYGYSRGKLIGEGHQAETFDLPPPYTSYDSRVDFTTIAIDDAYESMLIHSGILGRRISIQESRCPTE